jgi:hypothetical protein
MMPLLHVLTGRAHDIDPPARTRAEQRPAAMSLLQWDQGFARITHSASS